MDRRLGSRYRLGEPLGSGAMGQVFAGSDVDGRVFAVKILRPDLTGNPEVVSRFVRERSILVGLAHPNLVTVHDLVVEGETVAIVMDLVPGGDLRRRLTEVGTFLPDEIARIGAGIATALAEVHGGGVVHRDVKPENVLMDDSGSSRIPRLTDFGISRIAHSTDAGRSSLLAGTPQYVAPELAEGEEPTAAADLYSLGIVLYELCCGVTPFAGKSMLQVIRLHAEAEPGRPEGIPDLLWDMITWLLAKKPQSRPQSARQVATILEAMVPDLAGYPVALLLDEPPPAVPIAHGDPTQARFQVPPIVGGQMYTPPQTPRRGRKAVLSLAALTLVGGGTAWALGAFASSPSPPPVAAPVAQQSTATQPVAPVPAVTSTSSSAPALSSAPASVAPNLDPLQVYLDELKPVSGYWYSDQNAGALAGKTYAHTVQSRLDKCSSPEAVEYNISKGYRHFVTTAGIDDNAGDSSLKVQLEISGDGHKLAAPVLEYGKATSIDVDMTGILRLKIQWQPVAGDKSCPPNNYVDLGEAHLLGVPGEVPSPSRSN